MRARIASPDTGSVSARLYVTVLGIVGALSACGRLTGLDDYEIQDPQPEAQDAGGTRDADAEAAAPPCPQGQARVTVSLTPPSARAQIASEPAGIVVSGGATDSACLPLGTVRLRMDRDSGDWTSTVACRDGNRGADRCEFTLGPDGATFSVRVGN